MIDNLELQKNQVNLTPLNGYPPLETIIESIQMVNLTVTFVGHGSQNEPTSEYIWDFDDIDFATPENPNIVRVVDIHTPVQHRFSYPGKYACRFIELRADGIMVEVVQTITI